MSVSNKQANLRSNSARLLAAGPFRAPQGVRKCRAVSRFKSDAGALNLVAPPVLQRADTKITPKVAAQRYPIGKTRALSDVLDLVVAFFQKSLGTKYPLL